MASIRIPARFSGPPDSGNGGYTCGLLAAHLGQSGECTLRKPVPLEQEMQVLHADHGLQLKSGDQLIAEAVPADWPMPEVLRVNFAQAQVAAEHSPAFVGHPFPTCFVCGPHRQQNDGLRIFPGVVAGLTGPNGSPVLAAPWIPDPTLSNSPGEIPDEIIWSALDCPTGFAGGFPSVGKLVTGRLAVKILGHPLVGDHCVLVSWPTGVEGRKHFAAAALLGPGSDVLAYARATWIKLA